MPGPGGVSDVVVVREIQVDMGASESGNAGKAPVGVPKVSAS